MLYRPICVSRVKLDITSSNKGHTSCPSDHTNEMTTCCPSVWLLLFFSCYTEYYSFTHAAYGPTSVCSVLSPGGRFVCVGSKRFMAKLNHNVLCACVYISHSHIILYFISHKVFFFTSQQPLYCENYANHSLFILCSDLLQMFSQLGRNTVRETRPQKQQIRQYERRWELRSLIIKSPLWINA